MKGGKLAIILNMVLILIIFSTESATAEEQQKMPWTESIRAFVQQVGDLIIRTDSSLHNPSQMAGNVPIESNILLCQTDQGQVIRQKQGPTTLDWEPTLTLSDAVVYSLYSAVDMGFAPYNYPPYEPSDPYPSNGATEVDISLTLSWTGGDPDGDPVLYDVYFGTSSPPPLIAGDYENNSYELPTLMYETTYYWQIVAKDYEYSTPGTVWSFSTKAQEPTNDPPYEPNNPTPENNATGIALDVTLSWTGGDPNGDSVSYDVYFGATSPPPLIESDWADTSYELPTLAYDTMYYWQIVAKDYEFSTPGQIWHFTTQTAVTATPPPSPPPTATQVPPTATPGPECEILGVVLEMPAHHFQPGDVVFLKGFCCNDTETSMENVPVFIFLDIGAGEYWFAPTWRHWPPDIDYYMLTLQPGLNEVLPQPLSQFQWPTDTGNGGPFYFWGGMTNQNMSEVIGEIGGWDFSYSE